MKNHLTVAEKPGEADGLRLLRLWDVDEDTTYRVERNTIRHDEPLVCVRTVRGQGLLVGKRGRYELPANTVLILPGDEILHYTTVGTMWRFFWAVIDGYTLMPKGVVFNAPWNPLETNIWEEIPRLLSGSIRANAAASALLAALIRRWMTDEKAAGHSITPHCGGIQAVVALMHQRMENGLSIAEMAATARMSERNFRRTFREHTGISPKKYCDRLRLNLARELLLNGQSTVSETAFRLGFSSPFHFSSCFRRQFGSPPSAARGRASLPA